MVSTQEEVRATSEESATRSGSATEGGAVPPGPDETPLVGSTFAFLRNPFRFYERLREDYVADVVTYTVGGDRGFLLTHPDDIERVLVTEAADFRKGKVVQENVGRLVENGLFVTEGEQWQADRTLLQPMFYRERIEGYAATMTDYSARVADAWTAGEPVAVDDEMRTLTLEVLAKTLLDLDVESRRERIAADTEAMFAKFEPSLGAMLPLWVPTPRNRRAKRGLADFYDLVEELIAERRAAGGVDLDDRDDLLSLMLTATYEDGTTMDEATVRDQLITFLVAGHETTSLALTYALYLLASNPDKQARLHEELDAVLAGGADSAVDGTNATPASRPAADPTAADLFELDYLDKVLTETLRLYSPSFTIFRQSNEPKVFQGYEVPADSIISMPQWAVHRDPRWYDDPETFRPERWTDDFEDQLPDYAYFPFGGGPRGCIGNRFATMEAKLALATMCQRYRFEPVTDSLDLTMQITLQPDHPVEVRPVARTG